MNRSDLPIVSPCGADWAAMTRKDIATRLCAACNKHVTDLSRMTQGAARRLLGSQATEGLCVRYLYDERGEILFTLEAPKLVPTSRLVAVKRLVAAATIAAAPLSLTACMGAPMPPLPPPPPPAPPALTQGVVAAPTTSASAAAPAVPAPPAIPGPH